MPSVAMTNRHAEHDPQQAKPERADLPAEMRLEPGAARLAALHVIEDDGDDRRPAGEERADDGCGAEDAGEQAERVQRVDHLRQVSSELEGRSSGGIVVAVSHRVARHRS